MPSSPSQEGALRAFAMIVCVVAICCLVALMILVTVRIGMWLL